MPLNTVTTGNTVLAADVNQLVNVLQRGAGQTETGSYQLNGWGNASGCKIQNWIPSLSRGATPVSVTIDTSLQSPVLVSSPTANSLNSSGFAVNTGTTASTTSGYVGGNSTIQY